MKTVPATALVFILGAAAVIPMFQGARVALAHSPNRPITTGLTNRNNALSGAVAAASPSPTGTRLLDGVVTTVSKTELSAQLSDGSQHDFKPGADTKVTRNSQPATLDALRAGDGLTVTLDAHGNVIAIDAAGPETPASPSAATADTQTPSPDTPTAAATQASDTATPQPAGSQPTAQSSADGTKLLDGVVTVANNVGVSAQLSDGSQRDFNLGADTKVTRNSRPATLDEIQAGDSLTVTLDSHGNVLAIDAAGPETAGSSGTTTAGPETTTSPSATAADTETPSPATPTASQTEAAAAATAQPAISQPAATQSPTGGTQLLDGVVTIANNVGVSAQLSDGTQRDFDVGPDTRVTRNNRVTTLDGLQPGDGLTVTLDPNGSVVAIDAAGPETPGSQSSGGQESDTAGTGATLVAIWGTGIAIQNSDGVHNYRLAPELKVLRDGKPVRAPALQVGDSIGLTLDPDGRASEVDASSSSDGATNGSSSTPEVSQAASVGIIGLFVAALLALGGMLYRRRPAPRT